MSNRISSVVFRVGRLFKTCAPPRPLSRNYWNSVGRVNKTFLPKNRFSYENTLCSWRPTQLCLFSNEANEPESNQNEKKLTLYERLKLMYKEYWYVLVPVHVVTSAAWYGGFYYLVVSGVDIAGMMEYCGAPDTWVQSIRGSKAGAFVAAYTLYKLATPARYTVTLGGTTVSINYLKEWGWIKPMPNKEQLKLMYEERKGALKDLKTSYQDKMQVTKEEIKDEFIKTRQEMQQHYVEAKEGLHRSIVETKQDLKQGVTEASMEWKHVGGLVKKATGELIQDSLKKK